MGIKGINTEIAQRLIDILAPQGTIYITSERPLEPQFEKYRIRINPLDMHHVMAFASLYIGKEIGAPSVNFQFAMGRGDNSEYLLSKRGFDTRIDEIGPEDHGCRSRCPRCAVCAV